MSFQERLEAAVDRADSLVCIGLDPDVSRLPAHLQALGPREGIARFNRELIAATSDLVCSYKPNLAFYLQYGLPGMQALEETRAAIPADVPTILDAKWGDVGSTASSYAKAAFDQFGFDALTVNPYLGEDSLAPFMSYPDKGVIVLCKTSNPGSGEWQDLAVGERNEPLYLALAERANRWSRDYPATVGLVVGATYPDQLAQVRARAPKVPILLPGIGAQAADAAAAVAAGLDANGRGLIATSSRAIIYAGNGPDFAERARDAALKLRQEVNQTRAKQRAS